jgi:GT2 family glycosyltransferase
VDNDAHTPTRAVAGTSLPLQVIRNAANAGFAPACNQGAHGSTANYLLFLNPDACVGPESLARAVAWFEAPSAADVAVVGLPLVDDAGTRQDTCGNVPTARTACAQTLGLARLGWSCCRGFRMTWWDHGHTREVAYVSGACLLVRRSAFEQAGGFDRRFEIYLEDIDLCVRLRRLGWRTWFVSADPVTHVSGWERGDARAWRLAHSWKSLLHYAWRHLSAPGAVMVTLCVGGLAIPSRIVAAVLHGSWRDIRRACGAGAWLVVLLWRSTGRNGVTHAESARSSRVLQRGAPRRNARSTDADPTSRGSSQSDV